ncbi:DNA-3-methyladenine glycosylase I [Gilliamella sp. B2776]|uniref:DNA-3-methyladenine glycosylase I n=1 Tax=unclassified Gilliamella TaxID=2685620 RepID=UPI0022698B3E|nr:MULTISPECIES: DNA-3-methyladenine glycosylase I [unclassified Gilliamella]MCX8649291.1 DNA-3-methyladenine glycosylase I [Gilliamella sp. B2779]MCX8655095.1 DNA-3-methyladenine glycosylase I [Gilliamella sp. B2737]MCX8655867.1 DNA-3-methyladenine glycosylase I [Gilliamella sp. B2894]MCX8663971.1 DNA-3-methyladenine glycosylase I [Gilliamella sp. B2887]MCX8691214.1 DNA-3-methyladenine glycosylase I [Gilliamella sp. B2776]
MNHIKKVRCDWLLNDQIYINYHDNEWGVAQYDSLKLFEKICLEGQQAGLSWITILKKRDEYRRCFFNFDPCKIIQLRPEDIEHLLENKGLIRNRLKLNSIVNNAHAYLNMMENGENFSQFIWSFVDNKPIINHFKDKSEVPINTDMSDRMSKELKKRGFSFVGSTICYAFMQSMGLVDDHVENCFKKMKLGE